jgi:hypothetical protein
MKLPRILSICLTSNPDITALAKLNAGLPAALIEECREGSVAKEAAN